MLLRVVDSGVIDPVRSVATDEAMLMARHLRIVPNSLHLYIRDRPVVSLGYFEKEEEAVDLGVAKAKNVTVVKRASGGSAIYTDPGQLIYALVLDSEMAPESPEEMFKQTCGGVVKALDVLGLKAEFKPLNDVLVNHRKISGSAQLRRWDVVLQHGTMMVDTDIDLMFEVLRTRKKGRSKDSVTTLAKELGEVPTMDRVKHAMVEGISGAFGMEPMNGVLSHYERKTIDSLISGKMKNEPPLS
ncbi:MAG: lipoate--protein ligase family protein [Methanomassiliicoccales archaeon]|jgi:lipoate-protein ligase A